MDKDFTHINEKGMPRMVDVSQKEDTTRVAFAKGRIDMQPETIELIRADRLKKGNVLATAQVAGVMAAKKTSDLIPMCHNIPLSSLDMTFDVEKDGISVTATAKTFGKTGVEMEALTAVSVACLTIYDMCKSVDRGMVVKEIRLVKKSGGKSGDWDISYY